MKTVVYTQRVEIVESYQERRDCADQRISEFIYSCGYLPIALPNNIKIAMDIVAKVRPVGIIFTGGNDLVAYGGCAPERDELEEALLNCSRENGIPVYGFCRGMQMVACHFGMELERVDGHVAVRHTVRRNGIPEETNSYHNYGLKRIPETFVAISTTEDGVIEEMKSTDGLIWCTMWHPERETPFREKDIHRLQKFLKERICK